MSSTGLEVFDTTLHKTSVWLGDLMRELDSDDRHKAYMALRAVLHTLRDRLMVDEAVNLGAQLPMLIRGFYYEGWRPSGKPLKYRHKEDFLRHVQEELPGFTEKDLEQVVSAVFRVLSGHVTGGEVEEVKHQMPPEVRELWH
ncbi:MAG: DUF2267 domain-containing protein [Gammaproteobacteria bacterium]|nr:DUF2267 domain-containing protein [Gammaproteobacteria bacterium]NIR28457.1 DUF2267 domain-containing protein [Gammaproteobacteria bacterium]NIR96903.1 DUF2267 domain-containing protein [Gammaproteobacteria bacterium]NIT62604.1 DUF2267 domain-containing protein [Gammaproteobacteria bacterium]NIV19561.1 DUF2267 domain-containing protein [Gammaproteobacteria bacterium]